MNVTLVVILIFLFICYKIRWWRHMKYLERIPGPSMHFIPLFGTIHHVYGSPEYIWKRMQHFAELYYPICRGWKFEEAMVMIRHPDDAEALLSSMKNITKGPMYDCFHAWMGTGVLTSTGSKWKDRRKILTPAFHFNVLNQFIEIFDHQAKKLINSIKKRGREESLEVGPIYKRFTLNVICETSMGTCLKEGDKAQEEFRTAVRDLGPTMLYQSINPLGRIKWLFSLLPSGRVQAAALKTIHSFSTRIIEERKKYHEKNEITGFDVFGEEKEAAECTNEVSGSKKRVALLDLLIQVWKCGRIDDPGIREEVDTFIFGGHDTSSTCLTFTSLLLAEHKEIQERARREVNEVFDEFGGKLGMKGLQSLVYLEKCIKESLRLYPSVPSVARTLSEDMMLSGYLVPSGTTVGLSIFNLHRDPTFWPDPLIFDPDRFSPENSRNRHAYSYVPFSAGPRNCMGQKFAMLEMKAALAHLLHNFRMEAIDKASETRIEMDLVLRCSHPLRVRFSPINE